MTRTDSKYYTYQQASLSQKVAFKDNIFQKLSGADIALSTKISNILVLCEFGLLDKNDPSIKLMLGLLDGQRKAILAASEKTDIITKLGFLSPKADDNEDWGDEE